MILICTEIDTDMRWDWYWYALRLIMNDAAVIMRGDIVDTENSVVMLLDTEVDTDMHWEYCNDTERVLWDWY